MISVINMMSVMRKSMVASDSSAFKKQVNDSVPAAIIYRELPGSSAPILIAIMITSVRSVVKGSISVPHAAKSVPSCSLNI